jgi:hypothetical protein
LFLQNNVLLGAQLRYEPGDATEGWACWR